MKWYVTNGKEVKAFGTHAEAQKFLENHPDWYELMA
jgi:hypothetical protein